MGFPIPECSKIKGDLSEPAERMISLFALIVLVLPDASRKTTPEAKGKEVFDDESQIMRSAKELVYMSKLDRFALG